MKCPKCGNEMGEGKMYCEVCGEEIHIVPDFEPEIENSISDVLNNVADEIDPSRVVSEVTEDTTEEIFSTQDMRIDDASFKPSKEEKKTVDSEELFLSRKIPPGRRLYGTGEQLMRICSQTSENPGCSNSTISSLCF